MLGSNPSACRVSIKGQSGVAATVTSLLFLFSILNPFGEIFAINPGVGGRAPKSNRLF